MKHREFIYVGGDAAELNEQEYAAFFLVLQKSIVLSLEQRKLLTPFMRERCLAELEKQYSVSRKNGLLRKKGHSLTEKEDLP